MLVPEHLTREQRRVYEFLQVSFLVPRWGRRACGKIGPVARRRRCFLAQVRP
jgi:hypothetical protein